MCTRYQQAAAQQAAAQQQPGYSQDPLTAQPDAQAQAQTQVGYPAAYGQDAGQQYAQQYAQQAAAAYEQPQVQEVPAAQQSYGYDQPQLVKLMGLPWDTTEMDIQGFFTGFTLSPDGITIGRNAMNQLTGEAWVTLTSQAEAQRGVAAKHGQYFKNVAQVHVFIE